MQNYNRFIHLCVSITLESIKKWISDDVQFFEIPVFSCLEEWNKFFGLEIDLFFSVEESIEYVMKFIQRHRVELQKNRWIKIGLRHSSKNLRMEYEELQNFLSQVDNYLYKGASSKWVVFDEVLDIDSCTKILFDTGVKNVLIFNSDKIMFSDRERDCFCKQASASRNGVVFRGVDINLDELINNRNIEDAIHDCGLKLNMLPGRMRLEFFGSEIAIEFAQEKIEKLWESIPLIKKSLYISAAVACGRELFFTTFNTRNLYSFVPTTREIRVATQLPCKTNGKLKYSSLIAVNEQIWMIPCHEEEILVYETRSNRLLRFPILTEWVDVKQGQCFRKAVKQEQYIWLLPASKTTLIRINTLDYSIKLFKCTFEVDNDMCKGLFAYKCMSIVGSKLYLSKDIRKYNLSFDVKKEEFEIWDANTEGRFCYAVNTDYWIKAPANSEDSVEIFDLSGKLVKSEPLPDYICSSKECYAYWYSVQFSGYVYLLPLGASHIIRVKERDKSIDFFPVPFGMNNLSAFTPNAIYDIVPWNEEIFLIPQSGNRLFFTNQDIQIVDSFALETDLSEAHKAEMHGKAFGIESMWNGFEDYILTSTCIDMVWKFD